MPHGEEAIDLAKIGFRFDIKYITRDFENIFNALQSMCQGIALNFQEMLTPGDCQLFTTGRMLEPHTLETDFIIFLVTEAAAAEAKKV